ncbi:MAG TPA: TAXI family TRAP transporter solute-binding subunit [Vicinamibacterales bacterium]|nr:TAXI family TRAP transporter solute-binding subunit [Vicinamibacterales bacterium]
MPRFLPTLLACGAVGLTASGCSTPAASTPPTRVVLSIPFSGNAWESIGRALASEYNRRVARITAEVVMAESLESQVDAMEAGRVDLALEDAETAYLAYTRGTVAAAVPHEQLRAIGVMFSIAVQVAVPAATGITRIDELKGRRVDVGGAGGSVDRAARIILESYGFGYDAIAPIAGGADTLDRFKSGDLDARFFYSAFKHPAIDSISREIDVRVLPIDRARLGAIQERHHFLKLTTIPAGTYRQQRADVQTVGMDVLLLCRRDLPDSVVYELTRSLYEAVPALEQAHEAASAIDPERGPTASIPLHPGAARYYREREILE